MIILLRGLPLCVIAVGLAHSEAAVEAEGLLLLRLLCVVLHVLPRSSSPASATASCTTATRLLRRWTAHARRYGPLAWASTTAATKATPSSARATVAPLSRADTDAGFDALSVLTQSATEIMASTVKLLPMLDRAHSWLRTLSLSRGVKSLSAPVKALMELVRVKACSGGVSSAAD